MQISDAARQFAQERLKPFAAEWDREHRFPKEAIGEMAELGFSACWCRSSGAAATPATWPTPWPWKKSPPATGPARPS
jgi:alkylation response protein AidB-like acyl-CoA dehydrogenase